MDFKKILNRAVQFAEEKVGRDVETTRLEGDMESLINLQDRVKNNTERLVRCTEAVLQPNPNVRMEEYCYEKLDKRLRQRQTPFHELGLALTEAGNEFGPQTPYGAALIKIGTYQNMLGQTELDFVTSSAEGFLTPLRRFLEGDIKTVLKERKELNNRRLDLDAAKSKMKKLPPGKDDPKLHEAAARSENEMRIANAEFERQAEITRLLLEGVAGYQVRLLCNRHSCAIYLSAGDWGRDDRESGKNRVGEMPNILGSHLKYLKEFAEAQMRYYASCHGIVQELHHELSSINPADCVPVTTYNSPPVGSRKARVLCDYESGNNQELSLHASDIIFVTSVGQDGDWVLAQRPSGEKGRIPSTYIEFLE